MLSETVGEAGAASTGTTISAKIAFCAAASVGR